MANLIFRMLILQKLGGYPPPYPLATALEDRSLLESGRWVSWTVIYKGDLWSFRIQI
jgi:hypothetical protein